MAQVMSRDQTLLQLLRLDVDSGKRTVLAEERCGAESKWLNLHDMLHCLPLGWCTPTHAAAAPSTGHFHFIWASSRSGFCQLYLYKYDAASNECVCLNGGASVSASGGAAWVVDSIDGVDDDGGVVYFSASADKCSEKHLYRNSLHSPSHSPQKLTAGAGWHQSVVSCANGIAAVSHSSLVQSPVFALYKLPALDDTSVVTLTRELCKAVPSSSHETTLISSLVVPEFMTVVHTTSVMYRLVF
jgi:dipeptidyl-peptidase-4